MSALDYQSDRDYRQASTTYQGSQTVAVSAALVAGVAGVGAPVVSGSALAAPAVLSSAAGIPAPTISGGAIAAPATLVATAAVLSPTVAGAAVVSGSVVAGVGAVGDATVASTVAVTAGTVAGVAAVPSVAARSVVDVAAGVVAGVAASPAPTVSQAADVLVDPVTTTSGVGVLRLGRHVVTNTTPGGNRLAEGEAWFNPLSAENRLARFYTPRDRGINVWIVSDATVTTDYPADATTITRTIHGGHDSPDLTDAESDLLVAAGYDMEVGERIAA